MVASPTNLHLLSLKYQVTNTKTPSPNPLYTLHYMHYMSNCILAKAEYFSAKINGLVQYFGKS